MHSIETNRFLRQPKTIFSKPSSIQAHQVSKTQPDTFITFANFLGDKTTLYGMLSSKKRGTEHLSRAHFVISPFVFKKRETVFYNITYKPAVAHILKTLLEHDFHDVKILIIRTLLYFLVEKFVSFYLGLTNA